MKAQNDLHPEPFWTLLSKQLLLGMLIYLLLRLKSKTEVVKMKMGPVAIKITTALCFVVMAAVKRGGSKTIANSTVIPSSALSRGEGSNRTTGLKAEYYGNTDLADKAAFLKVDEKIDFEWGKDAPGDLPTNSFPSDGQVRLHRLSARNILLSHTAMTVRVCGLTTC